MTDVLDDTQLVTEDDLTCSVMDAGCVGQYFLDLLSSFGLWFYEKLMLGIVIVFESIPVPDFLERVSQYRLPDAVGFFADVLHLEFGAGVIVSAYVLRFLVRRLPIIG